MRAKLAWTAALLILCGALTARAFEVFHDPSNTAAEAPVPDNDSPVAVNVWVQDSGTYFGFDIEVQATGGMVFESFTPNDPNQVIYNDDDFPNSTRLRANRVEPDSGMSGTVPVGTLTVRSNGDGTAEVIGQDYINAAVQTAAVSTSTLASTNACDPTANSDGDGVGLSLNDCVDNCPFVSNNGQEDCCTPGAVGTPDGIGDACQCGDVTGDGIANSIDSTMITRQALALFAPLFNVPGNCDVTGDGACNSIDSTMITRKALGLSAPLFQNSCPNFKGP